NAIGPATYHTGTSELSGLDLRIFDSSIRLTPRHHEPAMTAIHTPSNQTLGFSFETPHSRQTEAYSSQTESYPSRTDAHPLRTFKSSSSFDLAIDNYIKDFGYGNQDRNYVDF
ncbi:GL19676, partial [Drosophila persimilis]